MESHIREKQQLEERIRDKDREIGRLKREKQEYASRVKELEAELVSLRKLATLTRSSSLEKKETPTSLVAQLPARPLPPEKPHQTKSVLANLPARPVFTGLDTSTSILASQPSLFAPIASPQMLQPRPTPYSGGIEPSLGSITPPTHATQPGRRAKGTVPPLLPHHQSFKASQMQSPVTAPLALFQNLDTPNLSQYATRTSASLIAPATRAKSYFPGPSTRHTHLPPVPPPRTIPPTIPASSTSTQQKGKLSSTEVPASGSRPLNLNSAPSMKQE